MNQREEIFINKKRLELDSLNQHGEFITYKYLFENETSGYDIGHQFDETIFFPAHRPNSVGYETLSNYLISPVIKGGIANTSVAILGEDDKITPISNNRIDNITFFDYQYYPTIYVTGGVQEEVTFIIYDVEKGLKIQSSVILNADGKGVINFYHDDDDYDNDDDSNENYSSKLNISINCLIFMLLIVQ